MKRTKHIQVDEDGCIWITKHNSRRTIAHIHFFENNLVDITVYCDGGAKLHVPTGMKIEVDTY